MYGANMMLKQRVRGKQVCAFGCCDYAHGQKKQARRAVKRRERQTWKREVARAV